MVVWGTSDRCGRCMGYTGVVWGTSGRCGGCRGYTGVVWGTGGTGGTPGSSGVQVIGVDGVWGTPGSFGVQVSGVGGVQGTPGPFGVPVSGSGGPRGIRVDTPAHKSTISYDLQLEHSRAYYSALMGGKLMSCVLTIMHTWIPPLVSLGYWATLQVGHKDGLMVLIGPLGLIGYSCAWCTGYIVTCSGYRVLLLLEANWTTGEPTTVQ
ncbi:hypothetical protein C8F04DRAFT_1187512 [Mycena alexandri]|uniref:Uncharacterized protein n=1 Tax=Mycena alexandri TaxID=1745969 RepID=A0AAD6WZW8_9AGAR|nr:hypothetical protein C8F04DRAFT_1187512 [Mycena alexandri]